MAKVDASGSERTRSGRDDDVLAADVGFRIDFQGVLVDEFGIPMEDRDVVAFIETLAHLDLLVDDRTGTGPQLGDRRIDVDTHISDDGIIHGFHHRVDGKPKGFAWDRTPMGTPSADLFISFDDGGFLVGLGRLHRGPLAAWACAYDDNVEMIRLHRNSPSLINYER